MSPVAHDRSRPDPVVTEIVRNGVIAVTEEMKTNLMRTAYNMIIYEALDFTVGLFTATGETVSIGIGLPMFIRGMAETVKAELRHFGADGIAPGDILVTNDAYTTGSHLNHVTLTMPIFHEGALVAFACCMGHWVDIGGVLGGMTTDIFSEGLQIPFLKYQRGGVVNQDLVDIIRMNVRVPSRALGDLRAQVTAVKTGERRFLELINRYGRRPVLDAIAAIMDQAEVSARARTRTIPDGVYEAESYMDDDGVDVGTPIPIRVRVIVRGDEMTVDLTDVAHQVRGFYNSGITTGHACAQVAYKCLTSPTDYPINDGSFRSLTAIVPPGRVVSATRPAPMRWWMTFPMTIVDTVFKALAPAIPDRVIAGHHADLLAPGFHGVHPRTSEFFIGNFGPLGGGWGAKWNEDGVSATVCINDGDTHSSPTEQLETKFPIVVERYALVPDSGGAGRHRGGLGIDRIVRARSKLTVNAQIDRAHCKPWGLAGGLEGTGNEVTLRLGGTWKTDFPNAKVLVAHLEPGDAFRLRSGGGGGYGSPLERPVEDVLHDVTQGYVSVEAAATLYGVVIDPATGEVDRAATERRGSSRAPGRLGQQRSQARLIRFDEQVVPGAGVSDLDSTLVNRFRTPQTRDDEVTLLRKLGMAREDDDGTVRPSVAGVLMGSAHPEDWLKHALIQAVAYRGEGAPAVEDTRGYQIDAKDITGPLDAQVLDACRFVARNMRVAATKTIGRRDLPQYDLAAVFEAVVNAVAHRDYSMYGTKIRLRMFANRLELYSPGALANTMTVESLPFRQASRNETIASLLAKCPVPADIGGLDTQRSTLMDRRGEGVSIVLERSERLSGKRPVYELPDESEVKLTIFAAAIAD